MLFRSVLGLIKEQNERVSELSGNLKTVSDRIIKLRQAQELVKSIQSNDREQDRHKQSEIDR